MEKHSRNIEIDGKEIPVTESTCRIFRILLCL